MRTKLIWDKESKTFVEKLPEKKGQYHAVHGDEIKPMEHPCSRTGEIVTSRSRWNRLHRENGCEEIDSRDRYYKRKIEPKGPSYAECAERAYYMCRDNQAPISERERETFKRIDETLRRKA